ncbi:MULTISPECIES: twin-arginine translocase TatA/TatE family subunit [Nonlabens]|uniref:Sec-independent protein translocase protein TatA n=1 Tax=Nonlabens xylanidelens TaxID=191564 RepID=A0A2S6IR15_9FLAO|nr:twin-arginine translocase TatA/TatE family subunit [Nonlabens xylanidelens]PPK96694.1 sec-independent protein translocase protein TatA [Nonlabens xylanidelens]PQJ13407.1 Sec-independent protein translocase TatA [Nonlabens xylanidelens]
MLSNYILLGMPGVGTWVVIVVAILILFGGKKIPELMRGIGGGIKEFKDATKEDETKKEDTNNLDR